MSVQTTGLQQFAGELEALRSNAYKQTDFLCVDLTNTFNDTVVNLPQGATVLALVPGLIDKNGNYQNTTQQARCFIRFNDPSAPALPFSLGGAVGDLSLFAGPMVRLFISNLTANAGEKLFFLIGVGMAVGSGAGGPSGGAYSYAASR